MHIFNFFKHGLIETFYYDIKTLFTFFTGSHLIRKSVSDWIILILTKLVIGDWFIMSWSPVRCKHTTANNTDIKSQYFGIMKVNWKCSWTILEWCLKLHFSLSFYSLKNNYNNFMFNFCQYKIPTCSVIWCFEIDVLEKF